MTSKPIESKDKPKYKHSEETKRKISKTLTGKFIGEKNSFFGRKHSEESKRKMSLANKGKNHPCFGKRGKESNNWLGENVGYDGLHAWIRRNLPPQKICQICFIKPPFDVACVTLIYNRDFKNWLRLCRSCHKKYDRK